MHSSASVAAANPKATFAVLVVSCDRYSDLWAPFFHLLDRFWPRRPGPVYLVTNTKEPRFAGVSVISVGPDESWSETLKRALSCVEEDYVLLWLEDLFLCGHVDDHQVEKVLQWVEVARPSHVRFNPTERPYAPYSRLVGRVPPGAPYRTTTVLSLWKKDVLSALLLRSENPWQFELLGSYRSDAYEDFYSTHYRCFPVINGVIRGKWQPSALRRLRTLGAPTDPGARPMMNRREAARFAFLTIRARLFKLVPWRLRRRLRRLRPI
jgi:hypothetical protein